VLNILSTYISLSILSDQERLIFHQLKIENEIRQIAINLNLPIKSVYRSISSICKKLNLTSIFSIRIFAKSLSPNIQTYEPIS
ncbi:LuxR C-terminal-related transcriptional regulator, partial [Enterobacter roggenkampii]|uniref:LuxR C-terminal-related transcriptional regulator n=2 Tax=Enterobacter roggenkampii TaxID=1812935 RepID=UPI003B84058C